MSFELKGQVEILNTYPKMVLFQHRLSKIKAFWLKNHVVNFFPIFGSFNLDREVFLNLANFDNKGLPDGPKYYVE